jgi:hypothetical protein
MEGLAEEKVTVVSDSEGDSGQGFPQQFVPGPAFAELHLFDIPLLRDVDDTGGSSSRLYFGMHGYQDNWPGGVLYVSDTGVGYFNTGLRSTEGLSWGVAINALPDTDLPFQIDTETELRVAMSDGELNSVTEIDFLNNVNAALVGNPMTQNWEIILFQNATQLDDGSYILDTLARGMRGTDTRVGGHSVGEFFIFLDRDTFGSYLLDLAYLNTTRYYKGVGYGSLPEDADIDVLSSSMADLKPYAPVHLAAVVDGSDNIDIVWVRRTRVGGELADGTPLVPLAEETESYSIDILDGPGGAVVRTLTSSTQSVQYDNADIVTDFGSVPASLSFVVYQISAAVGRGFGREATITF